MFDRKKKYRFYRATIDLIPIPALESILLVQSANLYWPSVKPRVRNSRGDCDQNQVANSVFHNCDRCACLASLITSCPLKCMNKGGGGIQCPEAHSNVTIK